MKITAADSQYCRRMGDRIARIGSWIAMCLSRGPRSPLGEGDVAALVDEMGESSYAGGTYVFRRGDPTARIHVVRTGTIALTREIGGRSVTVQVLRPGDVFGDVPAFLGEPEVFDARAIDDCTVLSLDTPMLFELLQSRPLIARRWFMSLAERMAGLQARLVDLLAGGIEAQLASILLREADATGAVNASQADLAAMLGVQRSSVQRVLKELEVAGLVKLTYRRVVLVDRAGLVSLLAEPGSRQPPAPGDAACGS
jgi:CRP-like cAMP-binding protein